ncbi:MAG TPA: dual specificity protein phosphatase family protein, partial [Planctomycetaceae bacterium]|nr:dual specificity protein phosphatase family protein [Planctomycetaceae bacterium]
LTAEFNSPVDDSSKYRYIAFPILDASTPDIPKLDLLLTDLADVEGLYIHCAEGHGRTGLVASCFILKYGIASNPKEALECIQEHRPLIRLNASQKGCLNEYHRGLHNLGHDSRYELED